MFMGLLLQENIENRNKYQQALVEIQHVVHLHHTEIIENSNEHNLKFKSLDSSYQFALPRNCVYLNTAYYRLEYETTFAEIVWECICILKEYFPSKIQLYADYDTTLWEKELLRRQLNSLQNKNQPLKKDEIEDIFAMVESSVNSNNLKGVQQCLSILNSNLVQPIFLLNLPEEQKNVLEKLCEGIYLQAFSEEYLFEDVEYTKKIAGHVLQKVMKSRQQPSDMHSQSRRTLSESNITPTMNSQSLLFQLKETSDIERVCHILDFVINKSNEVKIQKSKIEEVVLDVVIPKYCNGDYGIDQSDLTKFCVFHSLICQFISCCELSNSQVMNIYQICEEGMLNWIQNIVSMNPQSIYPEFIQEISNVNGQNKQIFQVLLIRLLHDERIQR